MTVPDEMLLGMQMHHNGGQSNPYGMVNTNAGWQFWIRNMSNYNASGHTIQKYQILGPNQPPSVATKYDFVFEVKHGTVASGAYLRLWCNGNLVCNITNFVIGFPSEPAEVNDAGQLKLETNYDFRNQQNGVTSVFLGPTDKLMSIT